MAKRAFSSTSSIEATGASAPLLAVGPEAGAAGAALAAGSTAFFDDMKYQPPPASASTPTATPMSMPIDLPDFSSPPLSPLDGAVTALSASAVDEMRAASVTARVMAGCSTGVSTSDWMEPSSISWSTMPADAPSRMAMTTGL